MPRVQVEDWNIRLSWNLLYSCGYQLYMLLQLNIGWWVVQLSQKPVKLGIKKGASHEQSWTIGVSIRSHYPCKWSSSSQGRCQSLNIIMRVVICRLERQIITWKHLLSESWKGEKELDMHIKKRREYTHKENTEEQ